MYSDRAPCKVCGSAVELDGTQSNREQDPDGPVDRRVCTNQDCPTNSRASDAPTP